MWPDGDHTENPGQLEKVYVIACGPHLPDGKSASTMLGRQPFNPYLCPICRLTWKEACKHGTGDERQPLISDDANLRVSYHAGLVNVLGAKLLMRNVLLEHYVVGMNDILDTLKEIKTFDGDVTVDNMAAFGATLRPQCLTVKDNGVDEGQKLLRGVRNTCKDLANHLSPPEPSALERVQRLDHNELRRAASIVDQVAAPALTTALLSDKVASNMQKKVANALNKNAPPQLLTEYMDEVLVEEPVGPSKPLLEALDTAIKDLKTGMCVFEKAFLKIDLSSVVTLIFELFF